MRAAQLALHARLERQRVGHAIEIGAAKPIAQLSQKFPNDIFKQRNALRAIFASSASCMGRKRVGVCCCTILP